MQRDLIDHFTLPPHKIDVIPNPVDVERIRRSTGVNASPYQNGKGNFVAVGRLTFQKGFDLLLRAFHRSLKKAPDTHLTIVGEGSEENALKKLTAELGIADSVSFVGHQDNPFPFMAHADLLISSSRWEGLPNAVLESLACGTPVLAFDCPGGTEEIIQHGENGWLVPSEDFESMGREMVEIVKNEKWLALQGTSLLPEKYRCETVVKRYEELFIKSLHDFI